MNQIYDQNHPKLQNPSLRQLLESNLSLLSTIRKAVKQYDKIFAIWGQSHFLADHDLYASLQALGVNFVVLVPTLQQMESIDGFKFKQVDCNGDAYLTVQQVNTRNELTDSVATLILSSQFLHYFDARIRSVTKLSREKESTQYIDVSSIVGPSYKLNIAGGTFSFFPNVDFPTASSLVDANERSGGGKDAALDITVKLIDNLFMFSHFSVLAIHESINSKIAADKYRLCLKISSKQPWSIKFALHTITADAAFFLKEMVRLKMEAHILEKGTTFVVCDADDFSDDDFSFQDFLRIKAPLDYEVDLIGKYSLSKTEDLEIHALDDVIISLKRVLGTPGAKRKAL